jgi:hypothetical protein
MVRRQQLISLAVILAAGNLFGQTLVQVQTKYKNQNLKVFAA